MNNKDTVGASKPYPAKVHTLLRQIDYAPARGKKVLCSGCASEIGRGRLRIREESNICGSRKWHLECYPTSFVVEQLGGFDKIQDGDKEKVLLKAKHPSPSPSPSSSNTVNAEETTTTLSPPSSSSSSSSPSSSPSSSASSSASSSLHDTSSTTTNSTTSKSVEEDNTSSPYGIGATVMVKMQANHPGKNVWFPAKIVKVKRSPPPSSTSSTSSDPSASSDSLLIQISYDDFNFKEWVPQSDVAPPLSEEAPAIEQFQAGTQGLGYRRKPGSTSSGWWYSVKVLRYLPDVPGAFVQWHNFPFPDSILEAGKIQLSCFPTTTPSVINTVRAEPQSHKRSVDSIEGTSEDIIEVENKKARKSGNDSGSGSSGSEIVQEHQE